MEPWATDTRPNWPRRTWRQVELSESEGGAQQRRVGVDHGRAHRNEQVTSAQYPKDSPPPVDR
jgi:hypothetical protein